MKYLLIKLTQNALLYIRMVMFFCFIGHGMVSLNISSAYNLHLSILQSVNYFDLDVVFVAKVLGTFDFLTALFILFNVQLKYLLPLFISYLFAVGIAGGIYFMRKTGGYFGVAEFFRRVPWMFNLLFLWFALSKEKKYFYLLRVGIAFAFIAHGLASVGFMGLNGGHVELATKILSEQKAAQFVYYTGFSDLALGMLLLSGILSRYAAIVGCLWLLFIVYLSFLTGLPEGLFRMGFLLTCFYVAVDKRCHSWNTPSNSPDSPSRSALAEQGGGEPPHATPSLREGGGGL